MIFVDTSGHSPIQQLKGLFAQCIGRGGPVCQRDAPRTAQPAINPNLKLGNEIDQLRTINTKLRAGLEDLRTNHTQLQIEHTQLHDKYTKLKKQLAQLEELDIADESPSLSIRTPRTRVRGQSKPSPINAMFEEKDTLLSEIDIQLEQLTRFIGTVSGQA